jgi:hypothetical protein
VTLVRHERDRGGGRIILVECPACGADLRGRDGADHFYTSHEPADFGLVAKYPHEFGDPTFEADIEDPARTVGEDDPEDDGGERP